MRPEERRGVGTLAFIHGLVHGAILAIPVLLALAWREEFRLDPAAAGGLAAVAYIGFGGASVPFGRLADRGGTRELLALSVVGIAVALAGIALSPGLPALAVSLAALGVAAGAYHPTALAFISRHVREQGRGMGWHGMGGSLGVALEPAIVGALLALGIPWRAAVAGMTIPPILAFSLLAIQRPASVPRPPRTMGLRRDLRSVLTPAFLPVLVVYAFAGIAYWGSLTFLPGIVGTASYALLLALGAAGQVLSGHLAERPRPHRTLFRLTFAAAGVLTVLATGIPWLLAAGAWAFGFLLFSLEPLQNTLVTETVPPEVRGLAFGMTFLSVFGIGSVGAILAGALLARGDQDLLFLLLAGSLAVSGVSALRSEKVRRTRGRG